MPPAKKMGLSLKRDGFLWFLDIAQSMYDRVSDVVENGGRFASKILMHNRMH